MKKRARSSPRGRSPASTDRLVTGVPGLDAITRGGLLRGGIYILAGRPGAGKTILSNQIAFEHVRSGGRVVYATLLAETHGRLLRQIRPLAFFDEAAVGRDIQYLNALDAATESGLNGLLQLVRRMVRDHGASLLVLDGMVTAAEIANSDIEYRAFIRELQTWVSLVDCTVLLVTSSAIGAASAPELTMVDGILELASERVRMRQLRFLSVSKFRGGGVIEGQHAYLIDDSGLRIFPRLEAEQTAGGGPVREAVPTGVPGLDPLLGGGLVPGSTTLVLGPSGAGKTTFGMHFCATAGEVGERALHFSFFEQPSSLLVKATRLHLPYAQLLKRGGLEVMWHGPAETLLDSAAHELLDALDRTGAKRVFIDGFAGLRSTAYPERISAVFSAMSGQFQRRGVTAVITDEARELFTRDVEVTTQNVSAIFHNIVFVRQVEQQLGQLATLRHALWVLKTRDTDHDQRSFAFDITDRGISIAGPFERARPDESTAEPRQVVEGAAPSAPRRRRR